MPNHGLLPEMDGQAIGKSRQVRSFIPQWGTAHRGLAMGRAIDYDLGKHNLLGGVYRGRHIADSVLACPALARDVARVCVVQNAYRVCAQRSGSMEYRKDGHPATDGAAWRHEQRREPVQIVGRQCLYYGLVTANHLLIIVDVV